jgi:hypothetical protein
MPATSGNRGYPFLISVTVDFGDDIQFGVYTHELLEDLMARLKSMGVGRVYWQYYGDNDPESYWFGKEFTWGKHVRYGSVTLGNIGTPLKAAVPAAHKHGLELYGVLRPNEMGYAGTYPEGSPEAANAMGVKRIGGPLNWMVPFVKRHPHMRLRRRPYKAPPNLESIPVRKIRLLKKDDSPTRIRKEHLQVWTSPANYRYQQRDVEFTLKEAVEPAPREVRDHYGALVTAKGAPVRTLTMEGLDLPDKYILVTTTFKDQNGDFTNTPMAMVEAYGPDPEPLPITVAIRMGLWGPPSPRDFRTYGLEFDHGFGAFEGQLDEDNAAREEGVHYTVGPSDGIIAFAKGKNEYVPVVPCEAYPEVRKLWSGWVDQMLAAGVDGIDMRVHSHGTPINEPFEYGFNEPLVEAYRKRFGEDLLADDAGPGLLAQLRGEIFTDFMRDTSRRVRAAGKKMQVHMHTEAWRPDPRPSPMYWMPSNINYEWQSWMREGLFDGILLRGTEDVKTDDPVALEALDIAREMGVSVYLNRGLRGVPGPDRVNVGGMDEYVADLETVFRDDRYAGFNIYDTKGIALPVPDGSRLVPVGDVIERIRTKAQELGLV